MHVYYNIVYDDTYSSMHNLHFIKIQINTLYNIHIIYVIKFKLKPAVYNNYTLYNSIQLFVSPSD